MRPSSPAPSKRSNHARAIVSSRVRGVTWIGGAALASACSRAARRCANGSPAGASARRARRGLREGGAALRERLAREVVVAQREQVEGDEAGRSLGGEPRDAAGGGGDGLLQRPDVQAAIAGDDDRAVDHRARREAPPDRVDDLGEVARHRPLLAAADLDLVAVAEDDRAKAVPFRLVELAGGDGGHGLGQHRRDGGHDGEVDPVMLARPSAAPGYAASEPSLFSGTNWVAVNVAPAGSAMTVVRIHGASNG